MKNVFCVSSQNKTVKMSTFKSNQKQFPLKCTHTNQDLCSQSPQMIWLICNPQVLNRVAANYFSQLCMLKHNMILGDSITDNYLNNQLWYTHLLYQIWCMFMYSSMKVDILTVLFCEETQTVAQNHVVFEHT
jgi:hypothetical protein